MTLAQAQSIELSGETLWLLPERALWWAARRILFIADLHLGKAATFRALGQPVPAGTTRENLARLTALIRRHEANELVVLGDFMHAAQSHTPSLLQELAQWRAQHAALHCTLVRGNHDDRAGDPPASLGVQIVDEPWLIGPLAACHHPQQHPTHHVLAGHVHPAVHLHGRGREHLRLPCYVVEAHCTVLPAFGEFTGGWPVRPEPGRRLYAAGGAAVWRLPG